MTFAESHMEQIVSSDCEMDSVVTGNGSCVLESNNVHSSHPGVRDSNANHTKPVSNRPGGDASQTPRAPIIRLQRSWR